MHVHFWGTRGCSAVSTTAETVRQKVIGSIKQMQGRYFATDEEIERFVDNELPISLSRGYGGNTPCVEITGGDEYIICDAGTGLKVLGDHYIRMTEGGELNKGTVFHLFISHLHWGHIQGFPFFCPTYIKDCQVNIYGFHKYIEETFILQQNTPYFPLPLKYLKADIRFITLTEGKEYEIGGFKVKGIRQPHPGDSYGYRFEKDGKTIVYSTDAEHKTSWDQATRSDDYPFIGFFKDADLLIFDAQYEWGEAVQEKEDWGHSSYIAAVELSVRSNVKHLCLFHSDPNHDDDRLEAMLSDAREYLRIYNDRQPHPMKIDFAYDGLVFEL